MWLRSSLQWICQWELSLQPLRVVVKALQSLLMPLITLWPSWRQRMQVHIRIPQLASRQHRQFGNGLLRLAAHCASFSVGFRVVSCQCQPALHQWTCMFVLCFYWNISFCICMYCSKYTYKYTHLGFPCIWYVFACLHVLLVFPCICMYFETCLSCPLNRHAYTCNIYNTYIHTIHVIQTYTCKYIQYTHTCWYQHYIHIQRIHTYTCIHAYTYIHADTFEDIRIQTNIHIQAHIYYTNNTYKYIHGARTGHDCIHTAVHACTCIS